jgi:valyl-tRNA synthetase
LLADDERLPVDPSSDVPHGYREDQRGEPGGFVGDPDVMDTWATSSLTPQIAGGWVDDPQMFEQVFPMNLRPQSHEIIRTWLFSTVVRADLEHGTKPWNDVLISGWVLDPDRKKMSKSIGNVVTPMEPLKEHGSDAIRHWAASARPGIDAAVDQGQFKVGRRLAIKVLNASRFCLSVLGDEEPPDPGEISQPVDLALIDRLRALTQEATTAFDNLDYARSLERTEGFFWSFCDDYLELVKNRAYADDSVAASRSARAALAVALSVQLRLFAPILPFVTEEVWSWWHDGSVHLAPWPLPDELTRTEDTAQTVPATGGSATPSVLDVAIEVLATIRKTKSEAKRKMRTQVSRLTVTAPSDVLGQLRTAERDILNAGNVEELELVEGDWNVEVVLGAE